MTGTTSNPTVFEDFPVGTVDSDDAPPPGLEYGKAKPEPRDKSPASRVPAKESPPPPEPAVVQPRVTSRERFAITSQLAIMARTGLDMATALQSLARQTRRPAVQMMLEQIHRDVVGGTSISDALKKYEPVFGKTYVATVAAGEATGRLGDILNELARLLRSEIRLRSSIVGLLAYPALLTTVSSMVILGLVLFVLPRFATIFEQFDLPLPMITRVFLGISSELYRHLWMWIALSVTGLAGLFLFRWSDVGRSLWDRFLLNGLLLCHVTRALSIGRTCRLLGITIASGVPLLESLRLARATMRNSLYQQLFATLEQDVLHGRGLGEALLHAVFVPSAAAEMILTAQRTGTLATVLSLVGEHYEEEGEARLRELVAVVEPLLIVIMGIVVAAIVLAVMLPMFDISTLTGYRS